MHSLCQVSLCFLMFPYVSLCLLGLLGSSSFFSIFDPFCSFVQPSYWSFSCELFSSSACMSSLARPLLRAFLQRHRVPKTSRLSPFDTSRNPGAWVFNGFHRIRAVSSQQSNAALVARSWRQGDRLISSWTNFAAGSDTSQLWRSSPCDGAGAGKISVEICSTGRRPTQLLMTCCHSSRHWLSVLRGCAGCHLCTAQIWKNPLPELSNPNSADVIVVCQIGERRLFSYVTISAETCTNGQTYHHGTKS